MKYAICYNPEIQSSKGIMQNLSSLLNKKSVEVQTFSIDELNTDYDFIFVIGGDGTILKASRFYAKYQTPVFGINLGRLGFLSQASEDNLANAVDKILSNDYKIENRIMLKTGESIALNDFVIKGENPSRLSGFILNVNGKTACQYLADGIIVSTPTGSTAYAMAAGGPILAPDIDNIVIVPICPHTFSARPIVMSADNEITVSSPRGENFRVSADGQEAFIFKGDLSIKKSSYSAKLALLKENDFYTVLRNKLNWGALPGKI